MSRYDCGRKCAPLNNGEALCCSTQHAVPVVHKVEFELLKGRTDLWTKFKPYDYSTRQIVEELTHDCMAIQCKGVRFCERDNRTIACRGFPFYPYLTRQKEFVGIGTDWVFEDRCWMMSNLEIVDRVFVEQFIATYEAIFVKDPSEFTTYVDFSASARRVHSRWKREIPLLGRDGKLMIVEPSTGESAPASRRTSPRSRRSIPRRPTRPRARKPAARSRRKAWKSSDRALGAHRSSFPPANTSTCRG